VHTASVIGMDTIAHSFPDVLWHTETPLLRTGPALMYHLAKLTRESGVSVVIGGEGADEIFLGNDLFKEQSVRRFCMRSPGSLSRRKLFERIHRGPPPGTQASESWRSVFAEAAAPNDPLFSHLPSFSSSRIEDFYTPEFKARLGRVDVTTELRASLPTRFFGWSPLNQAAYLEMVTRLSPYVLSSNADRMTMAHGVEGRYPFLDHRLFEFAAALPTGSRLRGLREKEVLRRWATRILPRQITPKQKPSQRAPDAQSFFLPTSPSWIGDHLTTEALRRVGIFSPAAVGGLVRRCCAGLSHTLGENQAMVGVLSTQLWYHQFVESALMVPPLAASEASVVLGESASIQSASTLYDPKPC
jgi:asparagine synthase (glutamine-hydrolysing)